VDSAEANGYPITIEVDGVVVTAGDQAKPTDHAPSGCFLVAGKKIVLGGSDKPVKPVRGYYIRLGPATWYNAVGWRARNSMSRNKGDTLLAKLSERRLLRVCFGSYNVVVNQNKYVREYRLWADGEYVGVRGSEAAMFNFGSCTDISALSVSVEPEWDNGSEDAFGHLVF
jgi:hypothetical protein